MVNLAIIEHKERNKDVISIFQSLGGNSEKTKVTKVIGHKPYWVYYIDDDGNVVYNYPKYVKETHKLFSLEEFEKKYPYKVGDRVRVPEYESEVCISKMYWDGNEVQYEVVTDEVEWYSAEELNEFNEPNKPNKEKKINQMSLANSDLDEVEIVLGDNFELKIREGKYYAIRKKILYPKTYEECCEVLGIGSYFEPEVRNATAEECHEFINLIRLKRCRNAYWKLYGERMGLGKPWEPDWSTEYETKYVIEVYRNNVRTNSQGYSNTILAFPTEEMRDAFF